mmetsp:Transcript_10181/g.26422  ORF Transcript_10181/g.26422 Transcript_10181/m.26422 type:complete len:109 (-) Transcript_10181:282-608(-)
MLALLLDEAPLALFPPLEPALLSEELAQSFDLEKHVHHYHKANGKVSCSRHVHKNSQVAWTEEVCMSRDGVVHEHTHVHSLSHSGHTYDRMLRKSQKREMHDMTNHVD